MQVKKEKKKYLRALFERHHLRVLCQMIAEAFEQRNIRFRPLRYATENIDELLDRHGFHQFEDASIHVPLQALWRILQQEKQLDD